MEFTGTPPGNAGGELHFGAFIGRTHTDAACFVDRV